MKPSDVVLESATLTAGADLATLLSGTRWVMYLTPVAGMLYSFGGWLAAKGY